MNIIFVCLVNLLDVFRFYLIDCDSPKPIELFLHSDRLSRLVFHQIENITEVLVYRCPVLWN